MSQAIRVLALDDERDIRELVQDILAQQGFQTMTLANPINLPEALMNFRPQVLLLDQMLPEKSGVDIIKEIRSSRSFSDLPIIILSGKTAEDDKVTAFKMGADDYVTKPFSAKELGARIQAVLRRASQEGGVKSKLSHKNLEVDLLAGRASVQGSDLPLTLTEYKLLVELMSHKGEVLSRENLRQKVIGKEKITERTIDVHMAGLRKKLGMLGRDIRTVRGVGYRFSE